MSANDARRPAASDQFLSEEDLDLRNLTDAELMLWWDHWLQEAQAWNDLDEHEYSHGVFAIPRREWPAAIAAHRERAEVKSPHQKS
jgi:hypothetical protein